jgi:outer membrane receptor protein involved in Fe transport
VIRTRAYFFLAFILIGMNLRIFANGELIFSGIVRDAYDKNVLSDANVVIEELQLGTATSRKGVFTFSSLSPGTYTLRITHVGYHDYTSTINLDTGRTEQTYFLSPKVVEIDPVTITATLNKRKISRIPGRVAVIRQKKAELLPANNTDDLLLGIANVHVNRPWGIFSKGASVSMRGLPGSARTLILLDGAPMNKVAGGTINWNFLEPYDVKSIEVVKGPNSALYGNNAMAGVISISTKRPEKTIEGRARIFGGSLGTYGGSVNVGGINLKQGQGFYWQLKGFLRNGDGYIIEPEETRDSTDAKVYLREHNAGLLAGYRFDANNTLDIEYRYYNGKHGTGTKVYEDEGSFDQYRSHLVLSNYNGQLGKYKLNARIYYQLENFERQSESMNSTGKYKLSDTRSVKHDNGLWMNISRSFFNDHLFTAGVEVKIGDLDANVIYRTSTDDAQYGGKLAFAGIFFQDEFRLFKKLSVIAGLRFDYARFYDGSLRVYNPTSNTGFIRDIEDVFSDESWNRFSPKLGLQYQINEKIGAYVSIAQGFMPPKIDDLVKSGKISKGFKLANPQLKPESLTNYEAGITWMFASKFSLEPTVYYSRGRGFQYFVATGDSVETGGSDLKPVLQRQNITEIEILGAEITATWEIFTNFVLTANYSINSSKILEFHDPFNEGKDLTGKALIEVPVNEAYASISWKNRIINFIFDWRYTGKEWYDDENTQFIPPYHIFGMKLAKTLKEGIGFTLTVQDIFDNVSINRKGKLTPGRFIIGEVFYQF